ncbi:23S rRNA (adenine(2503)-C(2))-methyltransferase RlmN [Paenibacillus alginolyticus]|uniref:Probable dual-specificity RNA methyltransferase RlmN n=3 Tax=Paenibacillus TaxID=44249 RepID=A0ABX1YVA2_9BACL|nr:MULTISPECIES: 23S rRNA (adenine(2503)-C(2))-methyltransferase RlmN [Paenibacillus]KQX61153.1 23S rRNA (adenine(2503)-C2)-methyltransferase [Paenibacillus sp. Root444D2]KRE51812.1 23S rRNA (adenine(2503)-C2)-methyltransferase [Paenibacillus sp. Soil724D2]MCY9668285.1 23S rRNA (adenine(2503)-C(2))-methyltransferase RlmN [Paenibacillus alginolyticus]MCY9696316.1 23S rRNA (adenine(2503)-C(2))-methyltransferase RlmN [Paenibacillus alginolyticus]MEC0142591.1 23S rRNA (adenine(2503)-C(2))-methyltr
MGNKPYEKDKPFVYDLNWDEWQSWVKENGESSFRAGQIFDWLYIKRVFSFDEMSNLPKSLRDKLKDQFEFVTLSEIAKYQSQDGTVKFLFELEDKNAIETVVMKHNYGNSICVTTQVGCRVGCTFCASTLGGLKRDLRPGEIVAQVVKAQKLLDETEERISSIVIMGIGEPFENYEATMNFLRVMIHPKGLNIGQRHITVSTSGIVPNIYKFADENLQVNLAISIHAPNDTLRSKLMPVNRRFPFVDLIEACKYYIAKTGRRITFEYALMGEVNDQPEHAEELAQVLKDMPLSHVNLIPVNFVAERDFKRTPRDDIFTFQRILEKGKINATIRREQGSDIAAACGQLRAKHMENK